MSDQYINPIGVIKPEDTAEMERQYKAQQEASKSGDSSFWSDVWKAGTLVDEVQEFLDVGVSTETDGWELDKEQHSELLGQYSQAEMDYLKRATSLNEFKRRQLNIEDDRKLEERLGGYGTGGFIATMGASLLDPVGWAAGVATGGLGKFAQMGRAGRIASGALMGAAEGYALGRFESMYNTQMTDADVAMQMFISSAMSGAVAGIGGTRSSVSVDEDGVPSVRSVETAAARDANELQATLEETAQQFIGPPRELEVLLRDIPDADLNKIRRGIQDADAKARAVELPERPIHTGQKFVGKRKAQSQLDKLSKELESLTKKERRRLETTRQAEMDEWMLELEDSTRGVGRRYGGVRHVTGEEISLKTKQIDDILDTPVTRFVGGSRAYQKSFDELSVKIKDLRANRALADAESAKVKEWQNTVTQLEVERDSWLSKSLQDKIDTLYPEIPRVKSKTKQLEDASNAPEYQDRGSTGSAKVGYLDRSKPNYKIDLSEKEMEVGKKLSELGSSKTEQNVAPLKNTRLGDILQATYTTLATSEAPAIRGWGRKVLENPQGATRNGDIEGSNVSIDAQVIGRNLRTMGGGAFTRNEAFVRYIYEDGKVTNRRRAVALTSWKKRKEFNKRVMLAKGNQSNLAMQPEPIQAAVRSLNEQYNYMLEQAKDYGVKGFEDTKYSKNYVVKVLKPANVIDAIGKFGKSSVVKCIAEAYHTGGFKLPRKAARQIAEIRIEQLLRAKSSVGDAELPKTLEDLSYLEKELQRAGVSDDDIADILSKKEHHFEDENISDRAKNSFDPNMEAKVYPVDAYGNRTSENPLTFFDLMDNDIESVTEMYIREMTANIAFQRHLGVSSYKNAKRLVDKAVRTAYNEVKDTDAIDRQAKIMHDIVEIMYGRSINKDNQTLARWLSRGRKFTSIIRLQATGITNLGEVPRVIAQNGIKAVLRSNPLMSKETIKKLGRKDLEEAEMLLGFSGRDYDIEPTTLNFDDMEDLRGADEGTLKSLGQWLDRALTTGQRMSSVVNLFNSVQGTGERMSHRSVTYHLQQGTIDDQRARDAGWLYTDTRGREVDLRKVVSLWQAKHGESLPDGTKTLGLETLQHVNPELYHRLKIGVQRLGNRDMQRMINGETPLLFNKWLGQTTMQFRSFTYGSISKQLLHDIRGDRIASVNTLMWGLGMAYLTNAIKIGLQAAGSDKEFDDLWEDNMEGSNLGMTLLATLGQTAGASIGLDALATFGITPDEWNANADNGWNGGRAITPPLAGTLKDAQQMVQGVYDEDWERSAKQAHKLLPFAKTIGISQLISQMYE